MDLLDLAVQIAVRQHAGQTDKVGHPYFYHPLRVADKARANGENAIIQAACLLHDVLEDTDITKEELVNELGLEAVGAIVAEIVYTVTKGGRFKGDNYFEWIDEIVNDGDQAAMKVKMYDALDNYDRSIEDGFHDWSVKYATVVMKMDLALRALDSAQ